MVVLFVFHYGNKKHEKQQNQTKDTTKRRRIVVNKFYIPRRLLTIMMVALIFVQRNLFYSTRIFDEFTSINSFNRDNIDNDSPSSLSSMPNHHDDDDTPNQQEQKESLQPLIAKQETNEPRIILHIGPHKSGTTAIQNFIKESKTIERLKKDNIVVPTIDDIPGPNIHYPEYNWAMCVYERQRRRLCKRTIWPTSKQFFNTTYNQNKSIILVAEDMDRYEADPKILRKSLKPYTNIQIIVTYRRLHDWFKSWYNEIMRLYEITYMQSKIPFRTFPEWIQKGDNYDNFYGRHTLELESNYTNLGFPVYPLHFHRQDHEGLLENLFCDVIGDLPNTCQHVKNTQPSKIPARIQTTKRKRRKKGSTTSNRVSKEHFYEVCRWIWMVKGFNKGRCQKFTTKYLERIKSQNISIVDDFPLLRVPSKFIDMAWNHTIQSESRYYPLLSSNYYHHNGNNESSSASLQEQQQLQPSDKFWKDLRDEFDEAIHNNWYAIDVDELNRTKQFDYLLDGNFGSSTTNVATAAAAPPPTTTAIAVAASAEVETEQQKQPSSSLSNQHNAFDPPIIATANATTTTVWNCLEIKDAEKYLEEWLDYHFAIGFTYIRIFDNSDNFDMKDWTERTDVGKRYKNQVKITHHPNVKDKVGTQAAAYKQCLEEAVQQNINWVATIDIDEFFVLKKHSSIVDLLNEHCTQTMKCGQLSFNWRMFGSANQTKYHDIPVTRRFQYMTDGWQGTIKVIVDPRAVKLPDFSWQHSMELKNGYRWLDTDGNVIKKKGWKMMSNDKNPSDVAVLHHYRYKSQEEWDFTNCIRGTRYDYKGKQRCHTKPEIGTIFDDTAWQQLRRNVPRYQVYDIIEDYLL